LLSEVIYHPTPQEIADTHVTPKFQNRAEEIRSGFSTFGAIAGGILGIPVTIFLRILLNKKY
jgi:Na+/glutamate symporter